jgi:hypothetical protein
VTRFDLKCIRIAVIYHLLQMQYRDDANKSGELN